MTLLVDTSVWSLALRRDGSVHTPEVMALREALEGPETIVTTGVILQELLQGFSGPKAAAAIIERFAALPLIQPDRQDHIAAAEVRNICRRSGVQDLLHGRPDACQRRKVLGSGSHHGVLGRQPDAIGTFAPHVLALDHPAGRCLPGQPAPVTDAEAAFRHAQAPTSVRVSARSYKVSSFSSSCNVSSGSLLATLMIVP